MRTTAHIAAAILAFLLFLSVWQIKIVSASEKTALPFAVQPEGTAANAFLPDGNPVENSSPASATQQAASIDDESRTVQEALESLLDSQRAQLEDILRRTQELGKDIGTTAGSARQNISVLEQEFQKISALSQSTSGIPAEQTFLAERLNRVKEKLIAIMQPLKEDIADLNQKKQALEILEKSFISYADATAQLEAGNILKNAARNISILLGRYESTLAPGRTLLNTVQSALDSLMQDMPSLWKDYYLESSGHFYDLTEWGKELRGFSSLKELFSLRISTEFPSSLMAWLVAIARLASAMAVFLLASMACRKTVDKTFPERFQSGLERIFLNSFIWIALGISIHFSAWSNGKLYQLLASMGTLFLCWGELTLAWDLYEFENTNRSRLSPLWPMFPTLVIGMVLLNFDPFPHFICVAWLLVQIFDLWMTRRRSLPESPLPNAIMRLYNIQRWITLIISLIGFARLAILINIFISACSVTVMLCVSIFKVERLIEENLPQEGFAAVLSSLAMALVMPLLFLVAVSATLLWTLAYPGGGFLLQHIASLGFKIGDFSLNAMQILSILIAFYLAKTLLAVGNTFMAGMTSQISRISSSLITPIQVIYKYLLWALFGLYTLNALGFNLSSLSMIAGGLSVGIGIGLQNIVQNFTSGLFVIFSQTLREGDVVEVGDVLGVVKKVNIRSTVLETYDNATIFIPNSNFLGGAFTNWTHNSRRVRKDITVGVAYGSDVRQCMALLIDIAKEHPKVLFHPAPIVWFTEFGASSLDLRLVFWVREYNDSLTVCSDIRLKINDVFAENGIEISFPQMDVHMREGSELKLLQQEGNLAD